MKMYIAGKMTGVKDSNRLRFNEVATKLRNQGFDVFNPAEQDDSEIELQIPTKGIDWGRKQFLKRDIPELYKCDGLILIDDWAESQGVLFEIYNALWMGMPILYGKDLQPVSFEILQLWLVKEVMRMTKTDE
jgi:hypothetical protein